MKRMFLLAAILSSATFLVSCGGGGGGGEDSPAMAAEDLEVRVDATNGAELFKALEGESVVYDDGVADFQTTSATKVDIVPAAANGGSLGFRISSDGNTATGQLEFGSCIFRVIGSNYPTVLRRGTVVRVRDCLIRVNTTGVLVDGQERILRISLTLNGRPAVCNVRVRIGPTGVIIVNSVIFGTVRIRPITGTTGGF